MITKRIWLAIPILLLPYLALLTLATIFLSTKSAFFNRVMESVFYGNALYLIATFLIYCLLVAVLSAVCFIVSIHKKWDAFSLAKFFMIVKLLQIPSYALIFVLGVLFSITIFTIPFSIALIFVDYVSLILSGLGVISAVINTIRQGVFNKKEVLWLLIAQFFFCIDVVAAMILYKKLKNLKTVPPKHG